jgi:hypothetical protein
MDSVRFKLFFFFDFLLELHISFSLLVNFIMNLFGGLINSLLIINSALEGVNFMFISSQVMQLLRIFSFHTIQLSNY